MPQAQLERPADGFAQAAARPGARRAGPRSRPVRGPTAIEAALANPEHAWLRRELERPELKNALRAFQSSSQIRASIERKLRGGSACWAPEDLRLIKRRVAHTRRVVIELTAAWPDGMQQSLLERALAEI